MLKRKLAILIVLVAVCSNHILAQQVKDTDAQPVASIENPFKHRISGGAYFQWVLGGYDVGNHEGSGFYINIQPYLSVLGTYEYFINKRIALLVPVAVDLLLDDDPYSNPKLYSISTGISPKIFFNDYTKVRFFLQPEVGISLGVLRGPKVYGIAAFAWGMDIRPAKVPRLSFTLLFSHLSGSNSLQKGFGDTFGLGFRPLSFTAGYSF